MVDHDVLIVGAGPVGLLLACLLAQRGRDVVICERHSDPDPRIRAIGIHRPGLDALDEAGLGDEVRAEALTLDGGEVRSRQRVLAALTFAPDRPVLVLPQTRTHALLRSRLDALDVDALRVGCTVRAMRDEGDLVRIDTDAHEGHGELTASLVVIADGVRSRLRSDLGFGWKRRSGGAAYAMLDVRDPTVGTHAVLHCEPAGLVESFPLPFGRRRWVLRQASGAAAEVRTAAAFADVVEGRTGTGLDLADDEKPTRFTAAQHTARRMSRGRIVLVGDAAHEISPIGGQGMNLGWADAVRLADAIARVGRGRMPELGPFEKATHRSALIAQRRSAFYMAMGAPASGARLRAREQLIRGLGSAPLRSWTSGLITMRGI